MERDPDRCHFTVRVPFRLCGRKRGKGRKVGLLDGLDYRKRFITVMLLSAFGFLGRGRLESVEDLRLPLAGYIGLES